MPAQMDKLRKDIDNIEPRLSGPESAKMPAEVKEKLQVRRLCSRCAAAWGLSVPRRLSWPP